MEDKFSNNYILQQLAYPVDRCVVESVVPCSASYLTSLTPAVILSALVSASSL